MEFFALFFARWLCSWMPVFWYPARAAQKRKASPQTSKCVAMKTKTIKIKRRLKNEK